MPNGYYELKKGAKFSFVLKAGNHEVILSSQSYESLGGAKDGVASAQKNGPDADNYEKKSSSAGQPYFVLKAANGQIIGTSEMYSGETARDNGIASVQVNSPTPTVKDLTA